MISSMGIFLFLPFATTITKKIGKKEFCTIGSIIACVAYI